MCQFHGSSLIGPAALTVSRRALLAGAGGAVAALALPAAAEATTRVWAIVGATVIDSHRREPIRDAVVVVAGDRIAWVGPRGDRSLPPRIEVVDGRGKYLIPGLVEAHHHLGGTTLAERAANLRRLLGFGYTTVFDPAVSLADLRALKASSAAPEAPYPRFFGTGPMLAAPGGWGDFGAPEFRRVPDPATAAAAVDELAAAGVDAIKAANDDFHWARRDYARMPVDVQRAIVAAARRHRIPALFHAPARELAVEALEAGAAGLLHGIVDQPVDRAFLRLLRRNGAWYVDTLALFETIGDVVGFAGRQQAYDRRGLYPPAAYDALRSPEVVAQIESLVDPASVRSHLPTLRANVRLVHGSGANVAFGCDGGFLAQALGIASQLELILHCQAGLSPHQVIRGATLGGARMLSRQHQIGSLTPGKLADLVVLSANPLTDLANLHYVDLVVKSGRIFRSV